MGGYLRRLLALSLTADGDLQLSMDGDVSKDLAQFLRLYCHRVIQSLCHQS
jgi:hypothetical protein